VNNVPTFDLTRQYKLIGEEVNAAVQDVLTSGCYIGGSIVKGFEQQFAD
jgi:dTDP-4-amino-4,6-dideoxygalactose transaminase